MNTPPIGSQPKIRASSHAALGQPYGPTRGVGLWDHSYNTSCRYAPRGVYGYALGTEGREFVIAAI
jgi:hypothetical protein